MKDGTYSNAGLVVPAMRQDDQSKISFTQKKYLAVIKEAQEMLNNGTFHFSDVHDSLNCGKLIKLINYISNRYYCVILWSCYLEVAAK